MALCAQELGRFTSSVSSPGIPTTDTDGYACYGARYANLWIQASDTIVARIYVYIYLYRTGIGWIRYVDVPSWEPAYVSTNGLLMEIEIRGAERIAIRRLGSTGTVGTILIEGFTYR